MGFISPHGLHIPIVTITRNNTLLIKRHICDIGNQFPGGMNLIDAVLPAWGIFYLQCQFGMGCFIVTMMFIVFTLQTMPGQYRYNPVVPCELRFLCLHTIIVKWLPGNKWFIQNQTLHKCVSPEIGDILSWICIAIVNIILHWQD